MHDSNVKATGGYVSREVKLSITLHLLTGDDVLNLGVMIDATLEHCPKIMYYVLLNWVTKPNIGDMNMIKYLGDKIAIEKRVMDLQINLMMC